MAHVRRRQFIRLLLGGAAAAWPFAVLAQQRTQVQRIGMLTGFASDDPEAQARLPPGTPIASADTRRNWLNSRLTLS
jgi:hypothetical protein